MLDQQGASPYYNSALAATKAVVYTGPCRLFDINAYASGAGADVYLQIFDAVTADVTVGTTTPTLSIPIPNGAALDTTRSKPIAFSYGLIIACTATAGGSGAPGAPLNLNMTIEGDGRPLN